MRILQVCPSYHLYTGGVEYKLLNPCLKGWLNWGYEVMIIVGEPKLIVPARDAYECRNSFGCTFSS